MALFYFSNENRVSPVSAVLSHACCREQIDRQTTTTTTTTTTTKTIYKNAISRIKTRIRALQWH